MLSWGFRGIPARCLSVEEGTRQLLWQEMEVKCRSWGKAVTRYKQWRDGCLIFKEAGRDAMYFDALKNTGAWRRAYES